MGSQAPLGKKDLFNTPGVELPGYIREVARALIRDGKDKSKAIQIAIGVVKNWAEGKGKGVNADTRAKAAKAVAEWEAAKAKARATPNKADLSNAIYAPGRVVLLAQAPEPGAGKAPAKKTAAKKPPEKAPAGKQRYKHGWIPVDENGKQTGPAQKPKWLTDAEAKHKAAGGRSAETIQAEKAKAEFKSRADKAAAPAKKAAAEKKRKEREAEAAKNKAIAAKKRATAEAARKTKAKERADEQKQTDRQKLINSAYKQAIADRKAGRELSEQQKRVIAHVDAQAKKDADKLRRVDVPGADGSKVAGKLPAVKKATAAKKTAKAAAGAVTANTKTRPAPAVKARSITRDGKGRNVRLSNPYAPWDEGGGVNVLDLSGSHNPLGQLAFRYKHGWILINPAIPSRGRGGGGLAMKHGHKSGTVTHGSFQAGPGGKGKVFVPSRSGGENNPAKLKAAHTKNIASAPNDKSKYGLVAAQKDSGHALKPSVPSAEKVTSVSKDANAASATANKTKSLHDAQVAAKKHADAFVQAKKAGNDPLAQSHKANAQAWAKKAQSIKNAEKASADLKKKYEAEQKAQADADKAKAEKAEAEKKAAQAKAKAVADKLKADKAKQAEAEKAMAEKAKADKEKAEKDKAKHLSTDAFAQTMKANQDATEKAHMDAFAAHIKAGDAYKALGMTAQQGVHYDAANKHEKKASALADAVNAPAAPKTQAKPEPELGPGMTKSKKLEGLANHIDEVMDDHDFGEAGDMAAWDDYLHASAKYKVDPSPANLKKLAAAQKKLTEQGVTPSDMQAKNSALFKKMGITGAAKKTVAQKKASEPKPPAKKTAAKKVAAPPVAPKAPESDTDTATPEEMKKWEISLPGPGMFKDGNAIMALMNKPTANPAQDQAKSAAVQKALSDFQSKHAKTFDPNNVEVDLYNSMQPSVPVPQMTSSFFDEAKAAGYIHPDGHTDVTNGWKPPAKTRPALLGYTGEGSYSYVPINGQLRGHKAQTKAITDRVKLMDEAFADAPPLPQKIVSVRKMKNDGQFPGYPPPMTEGDEYVDYGYGSTSKSTSAWGGKVVMEVRIPEGTRVIDVNHNKVVSCSTSEQEILLPRGVRYRVVKDEMIGNQRRITTEIVGVNETHHGVTL